MAKPLPPHDADLTDTLEPGHSRAICQEIGERLRYSLARDTPPVPTRLRKLVDRIAELEGTAPSIIPDCRGQPPARERPKRRLSFWRFAYGGRRNAA